MGKGSSFVWTVEQLTGNKSWVPMNDIGKTSKCTIIAMNEMIIII